MRNFSKGKGSCYETLFHDHFGAVSPNTNWKVAIEHGKKLGLGTDEYELIEVK